MQETDHVVVVDGQGRHSIWWPDRAVPAGWSVIGRPASRDECLRRIEAEWTGPRPGAGATA
ncbi:MbtH family NRPS accessory protein [Actinoplanes sp. NPDC049802]|uniref:MbtH family NRPS accessory protein n=1 Tax=Actinoplanes sp. NPDC049802 TaxID=3154742 RepID=UPI0033E2CC7B